MHKISWTVSEDERRGGSMVVNDGVEECFSCAKAFVTKKWNIVG